MILFKPCENVFCLSEIGGIAVLVEASSDESATWPPAVLPRDKVKICLSTSFDLGGAQVNIAEYAWDLKWRIFDTLEFTQKLVVVGKLGQVVHAVGIQLPHNMVLARTQVLS